MLIFGSRVVPWWLDPYTYRLCVCVVHAMGYYALFTQVAPSAHDQKIITMVTNYLRENGVSSLTVQVEKERFLVSGVAVSYVRQTFPSIPPEVYVNYGPHTGEIKAI